MKYLWAGLLFLWPQWPVAAAEPMVLVDAVALLDNLQKTTDQPVETLLLQKILHQYPAAVRTESISRNRARAWVKQAANACIPWLRKTPKRQQDFLFSLPCIPKQPEVARSELLWNNQYSKVQQLPADGAKALDAALALVALEQPKLPNAALPQELLSPAENASSSWLGIW